jgi:hypothetical protein
MCNLYSITTNQATIIALFRVINRYVGNLQPMPPPALRTTVPDSLEQTRRGRFRVRERTRSRGRALAARSGVPLLPQ